MKNLCETVYSLLRVESGREITADTDLEHDLGMDSLDLMNLLMEIEDTQQINISMNSLAKVKTVDDLIKAIVNSQGGNSTSDRTIVNDNISNN
jgi:acyl carrier protein